MGGEFTYQPKWDPIGFEPYPIILKTSSLPRLRTQAHPAPRSRLEADLVARLPPVCLVGGCNFLGEKSKGSHKDFRRTLFRRWYTILGQDSKKKPKGCARASLTALIQGCTALECNCCFPLSSYVTLRSCWTRVIALA